MSRRDQIRMTPAEVTRFLHSSRTMMLVSNGANGFPHPMPMWYAVDADNQIYMTTFRKSQKINNLRRDPRASLLIESGDSYQELKGVLIHAEVELIEDVAAVRDILFRISVQRGEGDPGKADSDKIKAGMLNAAAKRIGMQFTPDKIITWDHSKLGGVY